MESTSQIFEMLSPRHGRWWVEVSDVLLQPSDDGWSRMVRGDSYGASVKAGDEHIFAKLYESQHDVSIEYICSRYVEGRL